MTQVAAIDPVEGGSANNYDYAAGDPINNFDLNGERCIFGTHGGKKGACRGGSVGHVIARNKGVVIQAGGAVLTAGACGLAGAGLGCAAILLPTAVVAGGVWEAALNDKGKGYDTSLYVRTPLMRLGQWAALLGGRWGIEKFVFMF